MSGHWLPLAVVGLVLGPPGCSALGPRTGSARDPLVMSHLTHSKEDPLYSGSETGPWKPGGQGPLEPASVARKPSLPRPERQGGYRYSDYQESLPPGATNVPLGNYRWVEGRVTHRMSPESGWRLRYAPGLAADRYGGELMLVDRPELAILREGDRVYVEGRVVERRPGDFRYHVDSLAVLQP